MDNNSAILTVDGGARSLITFPGKWRVTTGTSNIWQLLQMAALDDLQVWMTRVEFGARPMIEDTKGAVPVDE